MELGPFAGPIYTIILLVDCLFFLFLEWWIPRDTLHYVHFHWNQDEYRKVIDSKLRLIGKELLMYH
jgi:phosphatidylinositol glycan class A protein